MRFKFPIILCIMLMLISLFSCTIENTVPDNFSSAVEKLKQKYAPDKRVAVFNIEYTFENDKLNITFETDNQDAVEDLKSTAENLLKKNSYNLNITKLPASELGDSSFAIINVSVANLRRQPKNSAELIDQSIMGTPLKVLKQKGYWYLVQTPYNYLGWTGRSSFVRCNNQELLQWKNWKKVKVISNYAQVFSSDKHLAYAICDAVYGSELKFEKSSGSWYKVSLPDGNEGFIEKKYCKIVSDISGQSTIETSQIVNTAKSFLGIPYLWGGNSTKGLDCSGFSQTVYKSQGYLLPRDANMQVNLGEEIQPDDNFSNVKKGDLLFFGPNEKRITHVAISLGGPDFIHSSGNVHINSFDKEKENFNKYRFETLRHIKRIVNE